MKAMLRKSGYVFGAVLTAAAWIPEALALCDGLPATGVCSPGVAGGCTGTTTANFLVCRSDDGCIIEGRGGNDVITSLAAYGGTVACGDNGNDIVVGTLDDDDPEQILAEEGAPFDDILFGNYGIDFVMGLDHNTDGGVGDYVDGGSGTDFTIGDYILTPDQPGDTCVGGEVVKTCL